MVDSIIPNLYEELDAVYDVTIVYEKPAPNVIAMLGTGCGSGLNFSKPDI